MEYINENISPVEIWGGVECTVARIRNNIYDQLKISGHENRHNDLMLYSDLGIKTIRYPLLWEKYESDPVKFYELHDLRLNQLRKLQIEPVAGLLHHGSGPAFTNLYDDQFPELFASYALKIARRYPWINYYTPINEPLTTARFSGLYGVWYPHYRDDHSFVRIFLNELKATVLSIQAIRSVNPRAKLIQTEDLCRIYSTPVLKYQADFENHRRWLTYDILMGMVNSDHPLWKFFISSGIDNKELEFFLANKTEPYICGFNYYITSERFLDHRISMYPRRFHGGNGLHSYVDIEAVRAGLPEAISAGSLLTEAWERYRLPVALTEVHMACTREEQLRWFNEIYQTAIRLKEEGVDFRAITAWSLIGSFDWDSLLRKKNNHYESGVYDIRSGQPRPTALAGMIKTINQGNIYQSNLLHIPGWWRRNGCFSSRITEESPETGTSHQSPVLIIGANGSLGSAFMRICEKRGIPYQTVERSQLDITSRESVKAILARINPWAVINAAGFSKIDEAEKNQQTCFRENTLGPSILAEICKSDNRKLVTFSTDQVFNGKKGKPYIESDCTAPLNIFGQSKKMAEERVLSINPNSLIIRSSYFFNPWHPRDALSEILHAISATELTHYLSSDIVISPAYIPDLINTTLDLLIDGESGIWHLSSQEETTAFEFTRHALQLAGLDDKSVISVPSARLQHTAERPRYSVLKSTQGISLPSLQSALHCYIQEIQLAEKLINT